MKALAITASIVFWTLVLGGAWLAFFPGPDAEGPIAVVEVSPPPEPAAAPPAPSTSPPAQTGPNAGPSAASPPSDTPPGPGVDLPPGFAVDGLGAPQQPAQPPASPPRDGGAQADPPPSTAPPTAQAALLTPPASPSAVPPPASPVQDAALETGSIPLIPVPVADLVEQSEYGPLPKVGADGKRPAEVYARPSRYAAKAALGEPARVAILISGLGLPDSPEDDAVAALPAPISVAYAAYGRNLQERVTKLRVAGHEILLQIPLEPDNYPSQDPGPHTLLTTLPPEENIKRLQWMMSRFTGYVGVTNYMGAKFESSQVSFLPVLEEVKARGLLYLDDGNVKQSTAGQIASMLGLDYSVAHVQIDDSPAAIGAALARLESVAKERGTAIGIASAKPATLKQLMAWSETLQAKGIVLVPVSAAVLAQRQS